MWNYCSSRKNSLACITICGKYHGEGYKNRAVRVILSRKLSWIFINLRIKNITFPWSLLSRILHSKLFPRLLLRRCQYQMVGNMLKMKATPSIYFNDDIDWSKYLHWNIVYKTKVTYDIFLIPRIPMIYFLLYKIICFVAYCIHWLRQITFFHFIFKLLLFCKKKVALKMLQNNI